MSSRTERSRSSSGVESSSSNENLLDGAHGQTDEPGTAGALESLRIVELGSGFGSAYAAKLMADLGAEVFKVEPLGGDPLRRRGPPMPASNTSALFAYLTTSKKSLTINYESRRGREIIKRLCERCDAVIIDVDSMGDLESELGPEALVTSGSTNVVAGLRALPQGIEYPKGTDIHAQALTGLCHQMGEPDRHPLFWPYSQGSYQSGLVACIAILGLLYGCLKGLPGEPTNIEVSTLNVLGGLMQGHGSHVYRYFDDVPGRFGSRAVMRPYRPAFSHAKTVW